LWRRRGRPAVGIAALTILVGGLYDGRPEAQELPVPDALPASEELVQRLATAIGGTVEVLPEGVRFIVRFDQDVGGLSVGAPVTVKGLRVGTVREIAVVIDSTVAEIDVPVVIDVVPERITVDGALPGDAAATYALAERLVANGLRAAVQSSTPFGGAQHVALAFVPDAPPASLATDGRYPAIPTAPSLADELRSTIDRLLERVAALPLEALVADLQTTLDEINALVTAPEIRQGLDALGAASVELRTFLASPQMQEIPSQLLDAAGELEALAGRLDSRLEPSITALQRAAGSIETAAAETTSTVRGLSQTLGPRSPLWDEVLATSREVSSTTRTLRLLLDYLERHPDALLRGRPETVP
jgi:paraquat-inducible protein B